MSDYQITIDKLPNYTKKWVLDSIPHTYQGLLDPESKLYDGEGRIKFLNPSNSIQTYLGTFKSGEITGFGTIWYSNGIIYKGQVVNSQKNGFGSIYNSDGKFQYDGIWIKDQIDKPIYTAVIGSNGLLESQGFQINSQYVGWVFTHRNGYINSIKYYKDKKCIRGFKSHILNFGSDSIQYKFLVNGLFIQTNDEVQNFLFVELPKISKPNNLHEFLCQESNLKMLHLLSFDYDYDYDYDYDLEYDLDCYTNIRKKNSWYKIFSSNGLEQIIYFDIKSDIQIELSNYNDSTVFVAETNFSTDIKIQNKINGSMWLVPKDKRNNMKLQLGSNGFIGLEDFECISKGEYSKTNTMWELDGQGWTIIGSRCYSGLFSANKILQGIEQNKLDQTKIYEGSFNLHGKYHGVGTEWFNSVSRIKYQGDFLNGKYHGIGSSYYHNSEYESIEYVGNWVHGYKHGQGTLFSVIGDEIYTGDFNHDQIR
jgi:hypothetical protein